MGRQVAGVSRRPRVGAPGQFGYWFARERSLRGISVEYVAVRVKVPSRRIRSIEQGSAWLPDDGGGRAAARCLARAIGADPEEAVARLAGAEVPELPPPSDLPPQPTPAAASPRWIWWAQVGALTLVGSLSGWALASWVGSGPALEERPTLIHRADYVEELLGAPVVRAMGALSVEGSGRLGETGPRAVDTPDPERRPHARSERQSAASQPRSPRAPRSLGARSEAPREESPGRHR